VSFAIVCRDFVFGETKFEGLPWCASGLLSYCLTSQLQDLNGMVAYAEISFCDESGSNFGTSVFSIVPRER
jgi:hypothetical protein